MPGDVKAKLVENATGPKSMETDGLRVGQHSLADQVAAHKYLSKVENAGSRTLPIRVARLSKGRPVR